MAHSGLQLQVLALYRRALRAARAKDVEMLHAAGAEAGAASKQTVAFVRERFRDDAQSVGRKDFAVIEHLLRKGERDLKMLKQMKSASFMRVNH